MTAASSPLTSLRVLRAEFKSGMSALGHHWELFDADDCLMLMLGDELALGAGASAATMSALKQRFSNSDLMEILVTGAYYCAVARVVNSLDLDLEPNHDALRARDQ